MHALCIIYIYNMCRAKLVVHFPNGTALPETVSEEDREKFECVVTISPTGKSTLNTSFTAAIDAALARLKALPS